MKMLEANLPRLMANSFIFCVLLITWCTPVFGGSVGCLDNDGKPVDWFIVFKMPRSCDQMYMDVHNQAWTPSVSLNETGHAIYNTLQQIYSNHKTKNLAYALYNDEIPFFKGKYEMKYGHTKGDVAFDLESGFWLVHSLPKFPPAAKHGYDIDTNACNAKRSNGQTFLCITFSYSNFDIIGNQLRYMYPLIYDHQLPDKFTRDNKNMAAAMKGKHVEGDAEPWTSSVAIESSAGQSFTTFAKYSSEKSYGFDKDMYDALVAPALKSSLLVQTWPEHERLQSTCETRYTVENVEEVELNGETFEKSVDHSKWAVSVDGDWICIGDINRALHQEHRAGGTVCAELPQVADAFRKMITATESCSGEHRVNAKPHTHAKPAHPKHHDEV